MQVLDRYLSRYAEPEAAMVNTLPAIRYDHALIIPAYQETFSFLERLIKQIQFTDSLIIVVINQPENDPDENPQIILHNQLANSGQLIWQQQPLELYKLESGPDILCIRRYQNNLRINPKQGVGLARKMGTDVALSLFNSKQLKSPWLCCTDADAHLPENYLSQINAQAADDSAALTFAFAHQALDQSSPCIDAPIGTVEATQLYEQSMRYYQAGLDWAGSRYAFHSLGSCLAIKAEVYAAVRGFPRRPAGEDFYLLNKVAKVGLIQHLTNCSIRLDCRLSDRVPFGTGPRVKNLLELDSLDRFNYYDPKLFIELKQVLSWMSQLKPAQQIEQWLEPLSKESTQALLDLNFDGYFQHHKQQRMNAEAIQKDISVWFDGLLTLRYLHYLRDHFWPNINFINALESAPFQAD